MDAVPGPMWAQDPAGVFTHRWWDGRSWTDRVAIDGVEGRSPVDASPRDAARVAASLRPAPAAPTPPAWPATSAPPMSTAAAPTWQHAVVTGPDGRPLPAGTTIDPQTGTALVDVGQRILAALLDTLLAVVTLGIGWLLWAAVTAAQGQTPAKRLMKIQAVDARTGRPVGWATYVLLRGVVGWVIVQGVLDLLLIGSVLRFMPLWDSRNQHIPQKLSSTIDVYSWSARP